MWGFFNRTILEGGASGFRAYPHAQAVGPDVIAYRILLVEIRCPQAIAVGSYVGAICKPSCLLLTTKDLQFRESGGHNVTLPRLTPVGITFVRRPLVGCNIRNPPLTRVGMGENLMPLKSYLLPLLL